MFRKFRTSSWCSGRVIVPDQQSGHSGGFNEMKVLKPEVLPKRACWAERGSPGLTEQHIGWSVPVGPEGVPIGE